jgi:hypothetical protein
MLDQWFVWGKIPKIVSKIACVERWVVMLIGGNGVSLPKQLTV